MSWVTEFSNLVPLKLPFHCYQFFFHQNFQILLCFGVNLMLMNMMMLVIDDLSCQKISPSFLCMSVPTSVVFEVPLSTSLSVGSLRIICLGTLSTAVLQTHQIVAPGLMSQVHKMVQSSAVQFLRSGFRDEYSHLAVNFTFQFVACPSGNCLSKLLPSTIIILIGNLCHQPCSSSWS